VSESDGHSILKVERRIVILLSNVLGSHTLPAFSNTMTAWNGSAVVYGIQA